MRAESGDGGALPFRYDVEIVHLIASSLHRYEGRPADGPRAVPSGEVEERESIEVRAGLGIVGDRHYAHRAHRTASVTIMAVESVEHVARTLRPTGKLNPAGTRRNILVRGADVDRLRGATFSLDSGAGAVLFFAHRAANPCAWMDVMLTPGAHRALRGRGGMRCEPLTGGILTLGPAELRSSIVLGDGGSRLF